MATTTHDHLRRLLPQQGRVREEDYLALTDQTTHLIEYTDGYVEVLPMPTDRHQGILLFFIRLLLPYLDPRGGLVRFAPLRLQIRPGKFREPDVLLLLDRDDPRRDERFWYGADVVLEVVSPDNPARDIVEKRQDYAEAAIAEYWIVNPLNETVVVLSLRQGTYVEHGSFARGQRATSVAMADFGVAVDDVFAAE